MHEKEKKSKKTHTDFAGKVMPSLQYIVVFPNSHSIDKTTCDPACSKTDSDEDDSADVRNLLCPEL
jgi:hypothetical protein